MRESVNPPSHPYTVLSLPLLEGSRSTWPRLIATMSLTSRTEMHASFDPSRDQSNPAILPSPKFVSFRRGLWSSGWSQRLDAPPLYGRVEASIEVHESVVGPELTTKGIARHEVPALTDQDGQKPEGLIGQEHTVPVPRELARAQVQVELAEAHDLGGRVMACMSQGRTIVPDWPTAVFSRFSDGNQPPIIESVGTPAAASAIDQGGLS